MALATGDGDEVWADLQGNYRVVWRKEGAEAYRELLLAARELLSVSSSPSGDNWRCTECKHVFFLVSKLSFIVSVRGPVTSAIMQKTICFSFSSSFSFLCCFSRSYSSSSPSNLFSCLLSPVSLFPPPPLHPAIPPLSPSPLSVCALITSPNWQ